MLRETIKNQMVDAMKAKDKTKKELLSLILSEMGRVEQDKKAKFVTDERKKVAREQGIELKDVELDSDTIEEINGKSVLTDEEEIKVIEKLLKSANETANALKGKDDKAEALEKVNHEIAVYKQFLPKQLTNDEIKNIIEKVINGLGIDVATSKDKGKIMKELMPLVKGKADGKIVNQLLAEYLK